MRNHFLFLAKAMSSVVLVATFGLMASSSAFAGDPVYKWKDASGQSHYSQQPPDGVKYETVTVAGGPANGSAASNGAHPAPAYPSASANTTAGSARNGGSDSPAPSEQPETPAGSHQ